MRHSITKASAVLLALVATACSSVDKPKAGVKADPYAVQVTGPGKPTCIKTTKADNEAGANATNKPRSMVGFAPVTAHPKLAIAAAKHACDMATTGLMSHIGSSTSGPGARVKKMHYETRLTAENIAAGPFDLNRVLNEWNNSSGHLENILIPQIRDFGIGRALSEDGKTYFWAAVYAGPK